MTGDRVTVAAFGGAAVAQLETLRELYAAVFAEPPYGETPAEVARWAQGFAEQAARPGFALVVASSRDRPVGFAYGYTLTPDRPYWRLFSAGDLRVPAAAIDAGQLFFVFELAVLAPWRRRGVGRLLHDALLDGRAEVAAILTVRPEATPARATYHALGWVTAGHLARAGQPSYEVLVRPLGPGVGSEPR